MIRVQRGAEPPALSTTRNAQLLRLRNVIATRDLTSDDFVGYKVVAADLWKAQHHKCCYCESKVQQKYNDVEHFRPKARADRQPGSKQTHGYWWLAFTWDNLLFSCPGCNRPPAKQDQFPLDVGSASLVAEVQPPGDELPLLLHPAHDSGVQHIEFVQIRIDGQLRWKPRARNGSSQGDWTIRICQLDRSDLLDLYTTHVETVVEPEVECIRATLRKGNRRDIHTAVWFARLRLLSPTQVYVGLSYDALMHFIPNSMLKEWGLEWPMPM